jgi:WD40 repeat protein
LARVTVDGIGVRAGQFSPDGRRAFTLGYKDGIKVIDLDQKKPKAVAIGNTKPEVFCVLPDGKRAVIAGPKVEIVSLETGKILTTLGSHENEGPVDQVSVSTDGAQAASCGCDCTIRVWRLGE